MIDWCFGSCFWINANGWFFHSIPHSTACWRSAQRVQIPRTESQFPFSLHSIGIRVDYRRMVKTELTNCPRRDIVTVAIIPVRWKSSPHPRLDSKLSAREKAKRNVTANWKISHYLQSIHTSWYGIAIWCRRKFQSTFKWTSSTSDSFGVSYVDRPC